MPIYSPSGIQCTRFVIMDETDERWMRRRPPRGYRGPLQGFPQGSSSGLSKGPRPLCSGLLQQLLRGSSRGLRFWCSHARHRTQMRLMALPPCAPLPLGTSCVLPAPSVLPSLPSASSIRIAGKGLLHPRTTLRNAPSCPAAASSGTGDPGGRAVDGRPS
jgi:hypothetical protein